MRNYLLAIGLIVSFLSPMPVYAAFLGDLIQTKSFPQCDDARVLSKVVKRFNWAERKTWESGIQLTDIERVRERRTFEDGAIPRRYCRGHARLSNGRHPTVFYLIEGGQGFAGNGFNVEFCINGFDRWNEDNGSCRVLRY